MIMASKKNIIFSNDIVMIRVVVVVVIGSAVGAIIIVVDDDGDTIRINRNDDNIKLLTTYDLLIYTYFTWHLYLQ